MMLGEPGVGVGVEADHRHRAVVVDQHLVHPPLQGADLASRGFQFDQHQGAVADQGQGVGQGGDGLVRAGQAQAAEVGGGVVGQAAGRAGQPVEFAVVEHHGLAVSRQLHVQLNAVAMGAGGLESGQGVFGRAAGRPQAAMGEGRAQQQVPGLAETGPRFALARGAHLMRTTASTSTAKFSGRR